MWPQVDQVTQGLAMYGSKSEHQDLKLDPKINWKPVQGGQDWGNVEKSAGPS